MRLAFAFPAAVRSVTEAVMFPIAKILLPVDFSERANQAVRFAVPVAERFHSEIILLYVLPPYREFGAMELASAMTDILANRRKDAEQRIVGFLRAELAPHRVRRLLLDGDPASEIVDCARREEAGLIVMPTHGYGPFRRLLLGSVTAKVLHDSDCPVWTTAHAETLPSDEAALKRSEERRVGKEGRSRWSRDPHITQER